MDLKNNKSSQKLSYSMLLLCTVFLINLIIGVAFHMEVLGWTSAFCILFLFSPRYPRKVKALFFFISIAALCFILTTSNLVLKSSNKSDASDKELITNYWSANRDYCLTQCDSLLSTFETEIQDANSDPFLLIHGLFLDLQRKTQNRSLTVPSGVLISDGDGSVIAWDGVTLEHDLDFFSNPTTNPGPVKIIRLPAESDAVFWKEHTGYRIFISIPLSRTALMGSQVKSSFIEQIANLYNLEAQLLKEGIEADLNTIPGIELTPGDILIFSKRSHTPSGSTLNLVGQRFKRWIDLGRWLEKIALFLAFLTYIGLLWNNVREWRIGWRIVTCWPILGLIGVVVNRWDLIAWIFGPSFSDPKVYAGTAPWLDSPGKLLTCAALIWITSIVVTIPVKQIKFRKLVIILSPLILLIPLLAAKGIVEEIIGNSSLEWWPDLLISGFPGVLILPISAILILGSVLRLVYGFIIVAVKDSPHQNSTCIGIGVAYLLILTLFCIWKHDGFEFIAGLFTLLILPIFHKKWIWPEFDGKRRSAIPILPPLVVSFFILGPLLAIHSRTEALSSAFSNIKNWVEAGDELRVYALESNMAFLSALPELKKALQDGTAAENNLAFELYSQSDISAVSHIYGVEIWDANMNLLDRFAPGLDFEIPPSRFFQRLSESKDQGIILSWFSESGNLQTALKGGRAIFDGNDISGFITITIPSGPLEAIPPQPEWGHLVSIFHLADENISYVPGSQSIFDNPVNIELMNSEDWISDPINNRYFHLFKLTHPQQTPAGYLLAVMNQTAKSAQAAGFIRLGFLSLLLYMVFATYRIFSGFHGISELHRQLFSFRNQILFAFSVIAILLPMIFAWIINGMLKSITMNQLENRIEITASAVQKKLLDRCVQKGLEFQTDLLGDSASTLPSDSGDNFSWTLLDAQGRLIGSSHTPLRSPLPLKTIAKVFYSNAAQCQIFSPAEGEVLAQVVLPLDVKVPSYDLDLGTLIVEMPINGPLMIDLSNYFQFPLDIYGLSRIAASSRPDLFNCGFIPLRLPSKIYDKLSNSPQRTFSLPDPNSPDQEIFCIFQDENNAQDAILVLRPEFTDAKESLYDVKNYLVLMIALLFISGVVIATVLGHRLASPIRRLILGAQRVSDGIYDKTVPEHASGELGTLTKTFNLMMADISRQRRDLTTRHYFITTLLHELKSGILATSDKGQITMINPAAEKLLKIQLADWNGTDLNLLLQAINLTEIRHHIDDLPHDDLTNETQVRYIREGRILHLRLGIAKLSNEPASQSLLIVMDDISATVRTSKMEAYTELARRVAHEIKNPLTPIQLSIEHLRQTFEDQSPQFNEIFQQCTMTILDEVRSLRTISTEFSRFARLPRPVLEQNDIRDLLVEIQAIFSVPPPGVRYEFDISDNSLVCRFDHDQMKRVFINLFQNALQAMPDGGTLILKAEKEGDLAAISVSDTGCGIAQEDLLKLFEPYFSTRKEGIGLGLVICKATVDEHGGEIKVESTEGVGSIFTVMLPLVG